MIDPHQEDERKKKPVRIQRKRSKGWRMPDGAVYVGRPSRWGNPWRPDQFTRGVIEPTHPRAIQRAVNKFREALTIDGIFYPKRLPKGARRYVPYTTIEDVRELRGKDLACWCPLEQPCHADVLLELANQPVGGSQG